MEYKELESVWKQYDEKLNNLEKINRKLLRETLLQKPQRNLNWLKFFTLSGLIFIPMVLWAVFVENENLITGNFDLKFILGCILTFTVVIYLGVEGLRSYFILKKMNFSSETIIQSLNKVIQLKKISNNFRKYVFFYYPAIFLGCILIIWRDIIPGSYSIIFFSVFFVITFCLSIWGAGKYKKGADKLEKDIVELKEYTE